MNAHTLFFLKKLNRLFFRTAVGISEVCVCKEDRNIKLLIKIPLLNSFVSNYRINTVIPRLTSDPANEFFG